MKIVSKIKRPGGSHIDIGGVNYHFKPESNSPDAPHVCDVTDEEHIGRFLSISEGYCLHGKDKAKTVPSPPTTPPPTIDAGAGAEGDGSDEFKDQSDEELRGMIADKTGRPPHPNTGRAKLVAMLRNAA